jgi:hypothetical protein
VNNYLICACASAPFLYPRPSACHVIRCPSSLLSSAFLHAVILFWTATTTAVMLINLFRFYRSSPRFLIIALLVTCVNLWYFRAGIQSAWAIVNLPFVWNRHASDFLISKQNDDFDLTFANYSLNMVSSEPTYPDLVPPVLHHIALGHNKPHEGWVEARQACLDYHEGWEAHLWTDENASEFVQEYFPQFKHTWDRYKYPVQRIDALRYMVLYEYGGMYSLFVQNRARDQLTKLSKVSSSIWISNARDL